MAVSHVTQWNRNTADLKPPPWTAKKKLYFAVTSLLPFIAIPRLVKYTSQKLANRLILPAAYYYTEKDKAELRQYCENKWKDHAQYNPEWHTIKTPDGVDLTALFLRHCQGGSQTPVTIYFNANFECADSAACQSWFVPEALGRREANHFVFFDYRGTGRSRGKFRAPRDLIVDGASIVDWVATTTPKSQIHFVGRSLGGAIALETQALDEGLTGRHVNECSFSTLGNVMEGYIGPGLRARFAKWVLDDSAYRINAAAAFRKAQGEKLIISHPEDEVISKEASLQHAVRHSQFTELELGAEYRGRMCGSNHDTRLQRAPRALQEASDFLFRRPDLEQGFRPLLQTQ
jgi:pimeloyl-ACP methyl ester carboxylesterase